MLNIASHPCAKNASEKIISPIGDHVLDQSFTAVICLGSPNKHIFDAFALQQYPNTLLHYQTDGLGYDPSSTQAAITSFTNCTTSVIAPGHINEDFNNIVGQGKRLFLITETCLHCPIQEIVGVLKQLGPTDEFLVFSSICTSHGMAVVDDQEKGDKKGLLQYRFYDQFGVLSHSEVPWNVENVLISNLCDYGYCYVHVDGEIEKITQVPYSKFVQSQAYRWTLSDDFKPAVSPVVPTKYRYYPDLGGCVESSLKANIQAYNRPDLQSPIISYQLQNSVKVSDVRTIRKVLDKYRSVDVLEPRQAVKWSEPFTWVLVELLDLLPPNNGFNPLTWQRKLVDHSNMVLLTMAAVSIFVASKTTTPYNLGLAAGSLAMTAEVSGNLGAFGNCLKKEDFDALFLALSMGFDSHIIRPLIKMYHRIGLAKVQATGVWKALLDALKMTTLEEWTLDFSKWTFGPREIRYQEGHTYQTGTTSFAECAFNAFLEETSILIALFFVPAPIACFAGVIGHATVLLLESYGLMHRSAMSQDANTIIYNAIHLRWKLRTQGVMMTIGAIGMILGLFFPSAALPIAAVTALSVYIYHVTTNWLSICGGYKRKDPFMCEKKPFFNPDFFKNFFSRHDGGDLLVGTSKIYVVENDILDTPEPDELDLLKTCVENELPEETDWETLGNNYGIFQMTTETRAQIKRGIDKAYVHVKRIAEFVFEITIQGLTQVSRFTRAFLSRFSVQTQLHKYNVIRPKPIVIPPKAEKTESTTKDIPTAPALPPPSKRTCTPLPASEPIVHEEAAIPSIALPHELKRLFVFSADLKKHVIVINNYARTGKTVWVRDTFNNCKELCHVKVPAGKAPLLHDWNSAGFSTKSSSTPSNITIFDEFWHFKFEEIQKCPSSYIILIGDLCQSAPESKWDDKMRLVQIATRMMRELNAHHALITSIHSFHQTFVQKILSTYGLSFFRSVYASNYKHNPQHQVLHHPFLLSKAEMTDLKEKKLIPAEKDEMLLQYFKENNCPVYTLCDRDREVLVEWVQRMKLSIQVENFENLQGSSTSGVGKVTLFTTYKWQAPTAQYCYDKMMKQQPLTPEDLSRENLTARMYTMLTRFCKTVNVLADNSWEIWATGESTAALSNMEDVGAYERYQTICHGISKPNAKSGPEYKYATLANVCFSKFKDINHPLKAVEYTVSDPKLSPDISLLDCLAVFGFETSSHKMMLNADNVRDLEIPKNHLLIFDAKVNPETLSVDQREAIIRKLNHQNWLLIKGWNVAGKDFFSLGSVLIPTSAFYRSNAEHYLLLEPSSTVQNVGLALVASGVATGVFSHPRGLHFSTQFASGPHPFITMPLYRTRDTEDFPNCGYSLEHYKQREWKLTFKNSHEFWEQARLLKKQVNSHKVLSQSSVAFVPLKENVAKPLAPRRNSQEEKPIRERKNQKRDSDNSISILSNAAYRPIQKKETKKRPTTNTKTEGIKKMESAVANTVEVKNEKNADIKPMDPKPVEQKNDEIVEKPIEQKKDDIVGEKPIQAEVEEVKNPPDELPFQNLNEAEAKEPTKGNSLLLTFLTWFNPFNKEKTHTEEVIMVEPNSLTIVPSNTPFNNLTTVTLNRLAHVIEQGEIDQTIFDEIMRTYNDEIPSADRTNSLWNVWKSLHPLIKTRVDPFDSALDKVLMTQELIPALVTIPDPALMDRLLQNPSMPMSSELSVATFKQNPQYRGTMFVKTDYTPIAYERHPLNDLETLHNRLLIRPFPAQQASLNQLLMIPPSAWYAMTGISSIIHPDDFVFVVQWLEKFDSNKRRAFERALSNIKDNDLWINLRPVTKVLKAKVMTKFDEVQLRDAPVESIKKGRGLASPDKKFLVQFGAIIGTIENHLRRQFNCLTDTFFANGSSAHLIAKFIMDRVHLLWASMDLSSCDASYRDQILLWLIHIMCYPWIATPFHNFLVTALYSILRVYLTNMEARPDGAFLFFEDWSAGQLVTGLNMTLLFNSILTLSLCIFVLFLMRYEGPKALLFNGDDHCIALQEEAMKRFFEIYSNFLSPLGFKGYGEAIHASDLNFCSQEMYKTKPFHSTNKIKTPIGTVTMEYEHEWIMDWEPFRGQKCLNYNTLNPVPFSKYVPQFLKSIKHHSSVPWFRDSYNEAVKEYGCAEALDTWFLRKFPVSIYTFDSCVHWQLDEEWWKDAAIRRYGSNDRKQAFRNIMAKRDLDKWLYYDCNLMVDRTDPKEKMTRSEEKPLSKQTKEKKRAFKNKPSQYLQLNFYDGRLGEMYGYTRPEKLPTFVELLFNKE